MLDLDTEMVTECHLAKCLTDTLAAQSVNCFHFTFCDQAFHMVEYLTDALVNRQTVFVIFRCEQVYFIVCSFKLAAYNVLSFGCRNCEGNQCWWNMDVLKGTGHRVFTTDCSAAQFELCFECAQQRLEWFAPFFWIGADLLKVFLEAQPAFVTGTANCNQFCDRFDYCKLCTSELVFFGDVWVKAPCHNRTGVGFAKTNRNLCNHCLCRGQLGLTAVWYHNSVCTDGGVKSGRTDLSGKRH